MKIVLTTDHAGFEQLKKLQIFLEKKGHECINLGPVSYDADDDYPDLISPAARFLSEGRAEVGIIMGGSGQGEAIVANRVTGIRCAVYYGPATPTEGIDVSGASAQDEYEIIRLSRKHNNANMLSLASRFLDQAAIEHAVTIWLDTPFSNEERHTRRINKIDAVS